MALTPFCLAIFGENFICGWFWLWKDLPNCCLQRCGKKSKGFYNTQYQLTHHSVCVCVYECAWVYVCMCGCCGLSAATLLVCGLWFLLGAISQWAAKLLQFEYTPSPLHLPLLHPSGNAFKQQFNSSLPAFCYWWGFRFCILPLLIDVRRVFFLPGPASAAFVDLWKLCNIFNASGVFRFLFVFCFVFFFAPTSVRLFGSSRGLACAHFYFIIFAGQPEAKSLKNTLCSGNISFESEHQYKLIKNNFFYGILCIFHN